MSPPFLLKLEENGFFFRKIYIFTKGLQRKKCQAYPRLFAQSAQSFQMKPALKSAGTIPTAKLTAVRIPAALRATARQILTGTAPMTSVARTLFPPHSFPLRPASAQSHALSRLSFLSALASSYFPMASPPPRL